MTAPKTFKIVFMGTPEFAVPSLEKLINGPDSVVLVVTQPDRPKGRGRKVTPPPAKVLAEAAGIPVLQPRTVRAPDFLDQIRASAPDLLVVAAFGQILPRELLDIPKIMPINVHGSLLPRYRGAAPIQWAIINGDTETGITIMKMDAGMDTGPILLKKAIVIGPKETFGELYPRMAELGSTMLAEALDLLRREELVITPQPEEGVSLAPPIKAEMARLRWTEPARRLACLIRAMDPRPGAYAMLRGNRLRLYAPCVLETQVPGQEPGTVLKTGTQGLVIATGKDLLEIRELHWPGKRRMPCADFLRGRPIPEGTRFDS
ncbi:MAG TPA: methionyl-tRNA formyltransferase [Thermodesulfobacteriaceae bacterium]|nr:methionyl-tRNA formyltransferase [Thermodesulfobacteriaceae bacterium]